MSENQSIGHPPTWQERLDRRAAAIARRLKKEFAEERKVDRSEFKRLFLRFLRSHLPPFGGRPTAPELDQAQALRKEKLSFDEIARKVQPAYADWDRQRRRDYRIRLMKGLSNRKSCLRAKRARKSRRVSGTG